MRKGSYSYVSPVLRRVFSKNSLSSVHEPHMSDTRSQSRLSDHSVKSGDLLIDVITEENVQFMDQPLRGKIELSNVTSPIENVSISLKGLLKTGMTANALWSSGFGVESKSKIRYTEREV